MNATPVREIPLSAVWQLARPGTLLTGVACALGTASAVGCGIAPDWAGALAALLLALGFHMGANLLHASYLGATDLAQVASPDPLGTSPGVDLIRQGVITVTETRQVAWAMLALVGLGGVALALKAGGGLLLLGMAGALLVWAFAAPPLRLGARGAGEVVAALAWWLVPLGADYVQRHHFFVIPAADAASFALLAAATVLLQRPPQGRWVVVYLALVALAYGGLAAGVALLVQPQQALWGWLSAPLSLAAAAWAWRATRHPSSATTARQLAMAAACVHGGVVALALTTVATPWFT